MLDVELFPAHVRNFPSTFSTPELWQNHKVQLYLSLNLGNVYALYWAVTNAYGAGNVAQTVSGHSSYNV